MRNSYHCDICGCFLDDGEGRLCDECREEQRKKERKFKKMQEAIQEDSYGQYCFEH